MLTSLSSYAAREQTKLQSHFNMGTLRLPASLRCLLALFAACLTFGTLTLACPPPSDYAELYRRWNLTSPVDKRYMSLVDGSGFLWPERTIYYCFDNVGVVDRARLYSFLRSAWVCFPLVGQRQGISCTETKATRQAEWQVQLTGFAFRLGSEAQCNQDRHLRIRTNSRQQASTTVGYRTGNPPVLNFDMAPTYGKLNTLANLVHELGHAWGLMHEHQRPSIWTGVTGGTAVPGQQLVQFDCNNLADWERTRTNKLNELNQNVQAADAYMAGLCNSWGDAAAVGFSAFDYLPLSNVGTGGAGNGMYTEGGAVDWDSIMIYGSRVGGARDQNGNRRVVWQRRRTANSAWEDQPDTLAVTADDAARLQTMYVALFPPLLPWRLALESDPPPLMPNPPRPPS